ncbi:MAG TPA: 4-hydroxybenzoate octaprenyltransferase [Archaeoglobus veneficus]|nr:4-hydroxybenzoate octaprenyltransferase [Archaeoglobus veneficus]
MEKMKIYAEFIKIEHTLFALPFAYIGALMAAKGIPNLRILILILFAFTSFRSAAMALNRIIDRDIDALNPRTKNRHIPAGLISLKEAYLIVLISLAIYFLSACLINETAFKLSPIPAITAYIYPYLKRHTCLSHFVLGLNLSYAPLGGWISVTNTLSLETELIPTLIAIAVIFWVAGFDIIYALQDLEFDRKYNLHSIGAHFGVNAALKTSAICHIIFFILLSASLLLYELHFIFLIGLIFIAILLFYQHWIVKDEFNSKKIQIAFFYSNALISNVLFFTILLGVFV